MTQETRTPYQIAQDRDEALYEGLRRLAAAHGVTLREPFTRYGNGEIPIMAAREHKYEATNTPCGEFGTLAEVLSKYPTRTGTQPVTGYVMPVNGWLYMQERDARRMVEENAPAP